MSKGKVYLVGAGPGDPGLITVKGLQLIAKADVILYDRLIPPELLSLAKPNAELIFVGKTPGHQILSQDDKNALLIDKAGRNKIVIRLKGGDSYLFGRGGEEALACHKAGVDFEVVPGITSALAVPCYAGIPPTHRDYASDIAIVSGHRRDDAPFVIPKADTVILLMSVSNLPQIVGTLLSDNWEEDTPIAVIEHGTVYDQRIVIGQLDNFVQKVQDTNLRTPALVVVGRAVALHDKLNWFGTQKNVLVLGNHPERYHHLGNVVHRRVIDCVALKDNSNIDARLDTIPSFDWIVFTSVNGAKYLFERFFASGKDVRLLGGVKIAAIGQSTATRLKDYGLQADLIPSEESSAGLLAVFAERDMAGKRVLLPCAEIAGQTLPDGLIDMGADVEKLVVYKTVEIEPLPVDFDYIHCIVFTSGSTVRAFVKHFGQVPDRIRCYCLGSPTLGVARQYGIQATLMPGPEE